jgi:hypothetical protein
MAGAVEPSVKSLNAYIAHPIKETYMIDLTTIHFHPTFDLSTIDLPVLGELFPSIELVLGVGPYLNAFTSDRSVIDSIADELGRDNIDRIDY